VLTQCVKGGSGDGRVGWLIAFDYNSDTVEAVKKIPHLDREWRPDEKVWWISEDYSEQLKGIFKNFEALAYLQGKLL